jgi:hypothetical protein
MLKSGASCLQISAISAESCRSSLCLLFFFSFCLQRLLCIAFQNKMNLFLPIFVIFLGRAGQFTCLLLVLLVQCLMLFWCRELWKESQKKKIKNMLFKRCHTTCLSTASNAPRMPQFLFSLQVLHIHVMERIACLVKDIWCCPCIY